jgi:hypothetical protein
VVDVDDDDQVIIKGLTVWLFVCRGDGVVGERHAGVAGPAGIAAVPGAVREE